jgi:membrane-associated protease RseP (regulator of RpoE activity)
MRLTVLSVTGCSLLGLLVYLNAAETPPEPGQPPAAPRELTPNRVRILFRADHDGDGRPDLVEQSGEIPGTIIAESAPPFVIGVVVQELQEGIGAHLGLPEGQGVVVQEVMPEHPAQQAGIQKGDILLQAGDKILDSPAALQAAIREKGESPITITWLHRGERKSGEVTPIKGPEPLASANIRPLLTPQQGHSREWGQRLSQIPEPHRDVIVQTLPGLLFPPPAPVTIPKDLQAQLEKLQQQIDELKQLIQQQAKTPQPESEQK